MVWLRSRVGRRSRRGEKVLLADVVPIVHELVPGLLTHRRPSVVCVRTTHVKYLVFDADPTRPVCVVEFGSAERLQRIDAILSELHRRCPGTAPRPLVCAPWGPDAAVHIQEGLPGVPWFRLADTLPTAGSWRALLERAVAVMRRLHTAVTGVPEWVSTVDVGEALVGQVRLCRENGSPLAPHLLRRIEESGILLSGLATVPTVWQHGDFSLNNLMVAPDSMAVIDFDEFGLTPMPLHDAFGLALSFQFSQNGQCPLSMAECLEQCVGAATAAAPFNDAAVRGLLLHHLLWRINQAHGHPTRAQLRARLAVLAERVTCAPGQGLPAIAAGLA